LLTFSLDLEIQFCAFSVTRNRGYNSICFHAVSDTDGGDDDEETSIVVAFSCFLAFAFCFCSSLGMQVLQLQLLQLLYHHCHWGLNGLQTPWLQKIPVLPVLPIHFFIYSRSQRVLTLQLVLALQMESLLMRVPGVPAAITPAGPSQFLKMALGKAKFPLFLMASSNEPRTKDKGPKCVQVTLFSPF
jgi:hypothetical protein